MRNAVFCEDMAPTRATPEGVPAWGTSAKSLVPHALFTGEATRRLGPNGTTFASMVHEGGVGTTN